MILKPWLIVRAKPVMGQGAQIQPRRSLVGQDIIEEFDTKDAANKRVEELQRLFPGAHFYPLHAYGQAKAAAKPYRLVETPIAKIAGERG